jgi:hypothetical protein
MLTGSSDMGPLTVMNVDWFERYGASHGAGLLRTEHAAELSALRETTLKAETERRVGADQHFFRFGVVSLCFRFP